MINLRQGAVFFLLTGLVGVACGLGRKQTPISPVAVSKSEPQTANTVEKPVDQILLLTFDLTHDSTAAAAERCTLRSIQTFNGRLKKSLSVPAFVQEGDLICNFYDREGVVLHTHVEEDPLTASAEVSDESGAFKRHIVRRESAELVIRVQNRPALHQLVIGKVMPDKTIVTISEFKL